MIILLSSCLLILALVTELTLNSNIGGDGLCGCGNPKYDGTCILASIRGCHIGDIEQQLGSAYAGNRVHSQWLHRIIKLAL